MINLEEKLVKIFEEYCFKDTIWELESLMVNVVVNSIEMLKTIKEYAQNAEVGINTKYKTMVKKIKPLTTPLPRNSEKLMKEASIEPILRVSKEVGHKFLEERIKELRVAGGGFLSSTKEVEFGKRLGRHMKAFSFISKEIMCGFESGWTYGHLHNPTHSVESKV